MEVDSDVVNETRISGYDDYDDCDDCRPAQSD
jgi:hypothetical protein